MWVKSRATRMCCLHSNQSVNRRRRRIPVSRLTQKSVRILHQGDKRALRWQRRRYSAKLLNKVVIFVLFPYKKYSRRFITVRLNHWWQMEYPGDAFHTFLDLDSVIYFAVNGTVTSLLVLIQNIWGYDMGASEKWQHFHFGVDYPFNGPISVCSWKEIPHWPNKDCLLFTPHEK